MHSTYSVPAKTIPNCSMYVLIETESRPWDPVHCVRYSVGTKFTMHSNHIIIMYRPSNVLMS